MTLTVTPTQANIGTENRPAIGVATGPTYVHHGVIGSIKQGVVLTGTTIAQFIGHIGKVFDIPRLTSEVFGSAPRSLEDPVSMVGVARFAGQAAQTSAASLLFLFAYLNVVLGLFNLLPLPPFDGGHLAVLGVEKLRGGKTIDARKLIPISATVLVLLVTLVMGLVYLDIAKPISLNHIGH
jgi:membrane-associated protease RseP (regulator of RpoE activity)